MARATRLHIDRLLDTADIRDLLYENLYHPRWDDVARPLPDLRQLHHGLPHLLLHQREDASDVTGDHAERSGAGIPASRRFFLYSRRQRADSAEARYRQWMTHKLASWIDQFGSSGCVGCGRCITWCPVGIDITEEVGAIRSTDVREAGHGDH